ncbi:MAG: alkaline phosphatase [Deltaproteobacteria bacterium]|nr:alkaline phosphatase [Candidatus Latescibacterota bacterium]NIS78097.1 alkaline phosphatase [Deltaproteobacteria bacterium]
MSVFRRYSLLLVCVFLASTCQHIRAPLPEAPQKIQRKQVILFIGDGMGFEHVKAAGMYGNNTPGSLSFESFPYHGSVTTTNIYGKVTDSAAASTAMATGTKVSNGVISVLLPGDGKPLKTIAEYFQESGQFTGLVTTTFVAHATPAAFAAHVPNRNNFSDIVSDYLDRSRPNVVFGGARHITKEMASWAGYRIVTDRESMLAQDTENVTLLWGLFGHGNMPYEYAGLGSLPHLSEMTSTALSVLDNEPSGFFLMVEGGRIDHASHANDIERAIYETIEFSKAVRVAMDWAEGRDDTLIIVTADHETGGLAVLENRGNGSIPDVRWETGGHTEKNVPVYALGDGADQFEGEIDNTDIFYIIMGIAQTAQ